MKTYDFTSDIVANLWKYQLGGKMHPFTCANRGDGHHRVIGSDLGMLIPTVKGWICPFCNYVQDWSHDFMADGSANDIPDLLWSKAMSKVRK